MQLLGLWKGDLSSFLYLLPNPFIFSLPGLKETLPLPPCTFALEVPGGQRSPAHSLVPHPALHAGVSRNAALPLSQTSLSATQPLLSAPSSWPATELVPGLELRMEKPLPGFGVPSPPASGAWGAAGFCLGSPASVHTDTLPGPHLVELTCGGLGTRGCRSGSAGVWGGGVRRMRASHFRSPS